MLDHVTCLGRGLGAQALGWRSTIWDWNLSKPILSIIFRSHTKETIKTMYFKLGVHYSIIADTRLVFPHCQLLYNTNKPDLSSEPPLMHSIQWVWQRLGWWLELLAWLSRWWYPDIWADGWSCQPCCWWYPQTCDWDNAIWLGELLWNATHDIS